MKPQLFTIGFFTDLHLSGRSPASRQDDYPTAVLNKLKFCLKRCSENCDLVVFGGDMTHSHRLMTDDVKERAIVIFHENLRDDLPFFYTYGQHDLHGENLASRDDSTTAFIMRVVKRLGKNVNELCHDKWTVYRGKNDFKIALSACPRGLDPVSWMSERIATFAADDDTRLVVLHHLVSDQTSPWLLSHRSLPTGAYLQPDEETRVIDVVLSGDLHCGFGPVLNELDSLFVNPGSVARTSKSKKELTRPVQGVDIVVHKSDEGTFSEATFWPIECARADEVFRKEAPVLDDEQVLVEETRATEVAHDYDSVIERLSRISVKRVDVWELLERKARETQLAPETLSYLLSKRPNT